MPHGTCQLLTCQLSAHIKLNCPHIARTRLWLPLVVPCVRRRFGIFTTSGLLAHAVTNSTENMWGCPNVLAFEDMQGLPLLCAPVLPNPLLVQLIWKSLILLHKTILKCMETQMCGNVLKQVHFFCLSFYTQQGVCFSHQGCIPNQGTWETLWSKWWMWRLVWLPVWLWHCRASQLLFVDRWSIYCVPVCGWVQRGLHWALMLHANQIQADPVWQLF